MGPNEAARKKAGSNQRKERIKGSNWDNFGVKPKLSMQAATLNDGINTQKSGESGGVPPANAKHNAEPTNVEVISVA
ncbi:MAG: hypothetical protein Ct9H90mP27_1330 [Gammaproteobacteria bacterium]|nr:MAG: hypothetical protein Ct9H90mP27_1330 [Gammaproteobacteria bacterium]